jgi:hypothetical protein
MGIENYEFPKPTKIPATSHLGIRGWAAAVTAV